MQLPLCFMYKSKRLGELNLSVSSENKDTTHLVMFPQVASPLVHKLTYVGHLDYQIICQIAKLNSMKLSCHSYGYGMYLEMEQLSIYRHIVI